MLYAPRSKYFWLIICCCFISIFIVSCSSIPVSPDPETNLTHGSLNDGNSHDRFLGEFSIAMGNGTPVLIQSRQGAKDFDGTALLSITDPGAPVYLTIKSSEWIDDPSEPDPNQGTWHYLLELRNNTNFAIYDPWLIFINLGNKEYLNPHGITSRAFVNPDDPSYASRPYANFGDADGLIHGHTSCEAFCELFLPKEAGKLLAPLNFVAYGSYPDDYIEVGEGHPDPVKWREAFNNAGGRGVVGSAGEVVTVYGNGFVQYFSGGGLFFNPGIYQCFYLPTDVMNFYLALDNPVGTWGLPVNCSSDAGPSFTGTYFDMFGFESGGGICKHTTGTYADSLFAVHPELKTKWEESSGWSGPYGLPIAQVIENPCPSSHGTVFQYQDYEGGNFFRHNSGDYSGNIFGIYGDLRTCWIDNELWAGDLGLPVTDAYEIVGGHGQDFEQCTIECTGSCEIVNCGFDIDFRIPVGYPDGVGYHISQLWMFYMFPYGYHLADDWSGDGDPDGDLGDPVYATEAGQVTYADHHNTWGNLIFVRHDDVPGVGTVTSMYGHCLDILVTVGDYVTAGQQIGTLGDADGMLSPHLHFEIRLGDNTTIDKSHNPTHVEEGPQGQVDPSVFLDEH